MTTKLQFLGRIALLLAVAVMVACSWLRPLDSAANAQIDAGLQRALISYATARALNGVISVAQGTEVTVGLGVGANLSIGEILDPVNDLVEQFSELMLIASIAFGIQKVLLSIGSHELISFLFTAIAVIWGYFFYRQKQCPSWISKPLVVLLMIRFAIPVVTIGSDLAFQKFMAHGYETSQQVIAAASAPSDKPTQPAAVPPKKKSLSDQFKGLLGYPKSTVDHPVAEPSAVTPPKSKSIFERIQDGLTLKDVRTRVDELSQFAEKASRRIIDLMVIFVLQTLVIPVLLLWALYGLARGMLVRTKTAQ